MSTQEATTMLEPELKEKKGWGRGIGRRRFAPLDEQRGNGSGAPRLRGVVFDVDGTLCLPQNHMFTEMRQTLGIHKPTDILTHLSTLPVSPPPAHTPPTPLNHCPTALAAIRAIERSAMTTQIPQPGLMELMTYLEKRGVRKGLCTRNFPGPVEHLCQKFMRGVVFGPVITRETVGVRAKPSPEGVWRCAEVWEAEEVEEQKKKEKRRMEVPAATSASASTTEDVISIPDENDATDAAALVLSSRRQLGASVIMVGDSLDDMAAGHHAGAATILLASEETEEELLNGHEYVDLVVRRLDEIVGVLEQGFEGAEKGLDGVRIRFL